MMFVNIFFYLCPVHHDVCTLVSNVLVKWRLTKKHTFLFLSANLWFQFEFNDRIISPNIAGALREESLDFRLPRRQFLPRAPWGPHSEDRSRTFCRCLTAHAWKGGGGYPPVGALLRCVWPVVILGAPGRYARKGRFTGGKKGGKWR